MVRPGHARRPSPQAVSHSPNGCLRAIRLPACQHAKQQQARRQPLCQADGAAPGDIRQPLGGILQMRAAELQARIIAHRYAVLFDEFLGIQLHCQRCGIGFFLLRAQAHPPAHQTRTAPRPSIAACPPDCRSAFRGNAANRAGRSPRTRPAPAPPPSPSDAAPPPPTARADVPGGGCPTPAPARPPAARRSAHRSTGEQAGCVIAAAPADQPMNRRDR